MREKEIAELTVGQMLPSIRVPLQQKLDVLSGHVVYFKSIHSVNKALKIDLSRFILFKAKFENFKDVKIFSLGKDKFLCFYRVLSIDCFDEVIIQKCDNSLEVKCLLLLWRDVASLLCKRLSLF
jgi:hypothetical protein